MSNTERKNINAQLDAATDRIEALLIQNKVVMSNDDYNLDHILTNMKEMLSKHKK